jgi:hypothetical protein
LTEVTNSVHRLVNPTVQVLKLSLVTFVLLRSFPPGRHLAVTIELGSVFRTRNDTV